MKSILVVFLTVFISISVCGQELTCKTEVEKEADDLSMSEKDFSFNSYNLSLEFLEQFPKLFLESKNIEQFARSSETWISYLNSLKIIKGYHLKQKALITPSKENTENFCNFLKAEGTYAD
ncbi:hypothetical protein NBRC116493_30350 [Aurantivibrio infirmus]